MHSIYRSVLALLAVVACASCSKSGAHVQGDLVAVISDGRTLMLSFPSETALPPDSEHAPAGELYGTCSIGSSGGFMTGTTVSVAIERQAVLLTDPCTTGTLNTFTFTHDATGNTVDVEVCGSDMYSGSPTCAVALVNSGSMTTVTFAGCIVTGSGGKTATIDGTLILSHCS